MPLAGFPAEDLYPATDLYPGVPSFRAIFSGPSQDWPSQMEGHLYALMPHARSVWRIDGVWSEGFATPEQVAAADRFYQGGYLHDVTTDQIQELVDAGYGSYITQVEVET